MKTGLKKKDWVLIMIIICVAWLTILVHIFIGGKGANRGIVKIEGAIQDTYNLSEEGEYEINGGTNVLLIRNGKASMLEADCPDQLCVHQKPIALNRESIICLPNKVVVEIESGTSREFDAVTR